MNHVSRFANTQGISLLSIFPLIAISSALILTVLTTSDNMRKSAVGTDIQQEVNAVRDVLNAILLDKVLCQMYFGGVNLSTTAGTETITAIPKTGSTQNPEFPNLPATTQLAAGVQVTTHLSIESMSWKNKTASGGNVTASLYVKLNKDVSSTNALSYGPKSYEITIPNLTFGSSSNVISGCVASTSGGTNTGWQNSSGDIPGSTPGTTSLCTRQSGSNFTCPAGYYVVGVVPSSFDGGAGPGTQWITFSSYICCQVRP